MKWPCLWWKAGDTFDIATSSLSAKHSQLEHSGIHVSVLGCGEMTVTDTFASLIALIFIYDYHPCSLTLYNSHFTPHAQAALQAQLQAMGSNTMLLPETTLWSYITQISSALKAVHGSGLASRNIDASKILVTGKNR
jgi:PAB-dependent poly(A)-specific ribonuclease subunit 3